MLKSKINIAKMPITVANASPATIANFKVSISIPSY
jgi:hypothetical protein